MKSLKKYLIRDKAFYKLVLAVALPVMAQNAVSQLVNVLDNLMVGSMGTEQMSGVTIANQFIFIFNLALYGGLSGPGIFGAQYYGKKDEEGLRGIFRLKIWVAVVITLLALAIFGFAPRTLVDLFIHEGGEALDADLTMQSALEYFRVLQWGHVPFAISMVYATTLRECRDTMLPMRASIAAVLVNLTGNWLLIGGNLGFPALGVRGAAIATVVSRYVECGILVVSAHAQKEKHPYLEGLYKTLRVTGSKTWYVLFKGLPILLNELLWSGGMTMLNGLYSCHGLTAVAATNINSTFANLFNVAFIALGSSIGIVVGNMLGENRLEEARDTDYAMIIFSMETCIVMGALLALGAKYLPLLYNTTDAVREAASGMLLVTACLMPINAWNHGAYFTMRSGGLTGLTMLMDSGFTWVVCVPVAYITCKLSGLSLIPCYLIVSLMELVKMLISSRLVLSGRWLKNIVNE